MLSSSVGRANALVLAFALILATFFALSTVVRTAYGATAPICRSMPATIYEGEPGSSFDSVSGTWTFTGTSGDDVIVGSSGGDIINAGGGNDTVCGGLGSDTIHGDAGTDWLAGDSHADALYGDAGNDSIVYMQADSTIQGGLGYDIASAIGSLGVTLDVGAKGFERAYGTVAGDTFSSSTAPDGAGGVIVYSRAGNDSITGSEGPDTLNGEGGADVVNGAGGNDLIILDQADTTAPLGGAGYDRGHAALSTSGITLDVGGRGFERADGSAFGDTFTSSTVPDHAGGVLIFGKGGDDSISGSPGSDTLYGEAGDDALDGMGGNDVVVFESGDTTNAPVGGGGMDRAAATGTVGVTLDVGGQGFERADGTTSSDAFSSSTEPDSAAGVTIFGKGGDDTIGGSPGPDYLSGDSGSDNLSGMGGNDLVLFASSDSGVIGGMGFDTARAATGASAITSFDVGTSGFERAYGTSAGDTFTSSLPDGAAGVQIYGLGGNDSLSGTTGPDVLRGDAGSDTLVGGGGNDLLLFESGDSVAPEGDAGFDHATASTSTAGVTLDLGAHGIEYVTGSEYVDTFTSTGSTGVTILGKGGNDSIIGGSGPDTFFGGTGGDAFSGDAGIDTIKDFNAAEGDTRDATVEVPAPDAAPTVTTTTPSNTAINVATGTTITVNFSESVAATTSSFSLECPTGTSKTFTLSSSPASSFTLTPDAALPAGTACTVTVMAGQVTDADTNDPYDEMAADYVFGFTTDAAPTVATTTPSDGVTGVAPEATITVNFSESVAATTSSFSLECPTGTSKTFTLSSSPASSFTLTPNADLPGNVTCQVTVVAAEIHDADTADGPDEMAADYVFDFTTDAAPAVTSTTPANGAAGVAPEATITVNFSESVAATTSSFSLECPTGTSKTFTLSSSPSSSFVLTPVVTLPAGTTCEVTVEATEIHDADTADGPDEMAADYVFDFTTADLAPTVSSTTPTNGATQQATNANLTVTFSEAVAVTGEWFNIACPLSGTRNVAATSVDTSPTTYTINPTANFAEGETCTVTVDKDQVADTDAVDPPNNLAANYVWSFTVDTAPGVSSTTPTNAAINQAVGTNLTVTFDEPVTPSGTWFTIDCATGVQRTPSNTPVTGGPTTFTLNPNADLPAGEICTVTIVAAQLDDNDTGDPPANMAADYSFSFGTQPVANSDSSGASGNIAIAQGTSGLLGNDEGTSLQVVEVQGTSGNVGTAVDTAASGRNGVKGKITLNANGSLTYDPPPGYTGNSDSFTYKVGNAAGTSNAATVTITISDIMWFICDACGGNNYGTLQNPFTSIGAFSSANTGASPAPQVGQKIYIRSGTYDGPDTLTLRASQLVYGQGTAASSIFTPNVNSVTAYNNLGATGRPLIQPSTGNGITVASGNTIQHLALGNSATDIFGSNFGTLTIGNVTLSGTGTALDLSTGTLAATLDSVSSTSGTNNINLSSVNGTLTMNGGALSGASARAVNISGGGATVSYAGTISNTGAGINIVNTTGGTITFSGNSKVLNTGANAAVTLDNNDAATVTFSNGGLDIDTTTGTGFNALNGATAINVSGPANTITAVGGTALNVTDSNIGVSGLTFQSISANGGANGIVLDSTGSRGGLTVSGNSGDCSIVNSTCTGGLIQNTTGAGVQLTATQNVVFTRLQIRNSGFHGINASGVNGLTLTSTYLEGNGNGDDENSLEFINGTGTLLFDAASFNGAAENLVYVENTNASLTFTVRNGSHFEYPAIVDTTTANSAILVLAFGNSPIVASVQGNTFKNVRNQSFQFGGSASTTGTSNVTFSNNTITVDSEFNKMASENVQARAGGISASSAGTSTLHFVATGNTLTRASGGAVFAIGSNRTSTLHATVQNNTASNMLGDALAVMQGNSSHAYVEITGNSFTNVGGDALEGTAGEDVASDSGSLDLVFTNNTFTNVGTNPSIEFIGGISMFRFGDADQTVCMALTGNTVTGVPGSLFGVYLDGNFGGLGGSITYEAVGTGAVDEVKIQADNPQVSGSIVVSATNRSNGLMCTRSTN